LPVIRELFLPFLVVLGVVIFVHELGHFLAAKWRRVRVLKFSLGFGPAIFKFTRGETEYRLSWIPLGGYVSMAGDTPNEDGSMPTGEGEFLSHPWYGRAFIAVAGPLANLVTAFLIMSSIGAIGVTRPDFPSVLGPLADTTLIYRAGLRPGDRITAWAGTPTATIRSIEMTVKHQSSKKDFDISAVRGDSAFTVHVPAGKQLAYLSEITIPPPPAVIGNVVTGMPAYKAGLKKGDRVLAVNGKAISAWEELLPAISTQTDKQVVLRIDRDGRVFDLPVTPVNTGGEVGPNPGRIGVEMAAPLKHVERYPILTSLQFGLPATIDLVKGVYRGMWLTLTRPFYYREYLGGPMFIAQAAAQEAKRGLDFFLQFMAMINIAIMAFNLLPIPILDGGHIALALLQGLRRQSISYRAYVRFQKVGLAVVGTLFVLILANDPLRWLQRQRALDKAPQEGQVAPTPP
jgi:regulator of sigma E protease